MTSYLPSERVPFDFCQSQFCVVCDDLTTKPVEVLTKLSFDGREPARHRAEFNLFLIVKPNVVVEWWSFLLRIREIPGTNLGPETGYTGCGFS
jgi:hypothetical protein